MTAPRCAACGSTNLWVYVLDPEAWACDDCGAENAPTWHAA